MWNIIDTILLTPWSFQLERKDIEICEENLIGKEIKVRFDENYFTDDPTCREFLFALKTTSPFPEDVRFEGNWKI